MNVSSLSEFVFLSEVVITCIFFNFTAANGNALD